MAHLMAHGGLDLRQRAAFQQIVVESDALGAEKSADVGADARGLAGSIHYVDIAGGNAVGARHTEDGVAHRAIFQASVFVKERKNKDRRDDQPNGNEDDCRCRSPDPPGASQPAHNGEQRDNGERVQNQIHRNIHQDIAHPGAESLRG